MDIYLIIVVALFALAISDLIVGVSNDAVNFLNSAVGSKAAPIKVLLLVAAVGVLFGATFSSGMMEVARKGIFHPQMFYFNEIMIIFLAVMLTDIILLDLFNTFGMPTSTTVSIVFEILGAAVAVALVKLLQLGDGLETLGQYINTQKALFIIGGILFSVVVAFLFGAILQYISRVVFSFSYKKTMKYFGAIWGGIALTAIVYFILLKGVKGASFMTTDLKDFIKANNFYILLGAFIGGTVIFQLLYIFFKVNILKITVILGTFALAMAFAGNDLVNFIGVPLAGFESFKAYTAAEGANPESFLMTSLQAKVKTPTLLLLLAGLIMVLTLYLSKKARSVLKTSIDLSSQDEVDERFTSSVFARTVVRGSIKSGNALSKYIPQSVKNFFNARFAPPTEAQSNEGEVAFDLVRASTNLVVASILIAFATSLKLPLSTTYVTFMVAMGTSLADGAWDRESAVYRISGVVTVIGGWFFTAFTAFTSAFIVAVILFYGGVYAILGMILLAVFLIIKSHALHKKRSEDSVDDLKEFKVINSDKVLERCNNTLINELTSIIDIVDHTFKGLKSEKRKELHNSYKDAKELRKNVLKAKNKIPATLRKLDDPVSDSGHNYVETIERLYDMANIANRIIEPAYNHVDNNHKPINDLQAKFLKELNNSTKEFLTNILDLVKSDECDPKVIESNGKKLLARIKEIKKTQLKNFKKEKKRTRVSMMFLEVLSEIKNLVRFGMVLTEAYCEYRENK